MINMAYFARLHLENASIEFKAFLSGILEQWNAAGKTRPTRRAKACERAEMPRMHWRIDCNRAARRKLRSSSLYRWIHCSSNCRAHRTRQWRYVHTYVRREQYSGEFRSRGKEHLVERLSGRSTLDKLFRIERD